MAESAVTGHVVNLLEFLRFENFSIAEGTLFIRKHETWRKHYLKNQ